METSNKCRKTNNNLNLYIRILKWRLEKSIPNSSKIWRDFCNYSLCISVKQRHLSSLQSWDENDRKSMSEKKKITRVFRSARFLPSFARSPSAARCPKSICFTHKMSSLVVPLLSLASLPLGLSLRSTIFLLLFLFLSGRSRTSRLSLLHLFIGPLYYLQFGAHSREGNFILVFCPVALRPPNRRFLASSGFPFFLASSSSSTVLLPFLVDAERARLRAYSASIVMPTRNVVRRRDEMAIDWMGYGFVDDYCKFARRSWNVAKSNLT